MWKVGPELQFVDHFPVTLVHIGSSGCKFQRVYFCAQARCLRALGLRRGLRWTQNVQCCPETPLRRPNGDPGVPKYAPRLPKVFQRGHKGSQKRDKRSAMRSPEHALAFQSAFKGVLYTPKLPIDRTSGHYVTNICCGIISTVTIRIIIIIIISTDTITITLLSLLLYYYWWGLWGLVCPARPPSGLPPAPERANTAPRHGAEKLRGETRGPAKTDKMRDPCKGFWRRPTPIVSFERTHPCPEYCNWFSPGGNSPKHVWRLLAFYFSMFLGGVVV